MTDDPRAQLHALLAAKLRDATCEHVPLNPGTVPGQPEACPECLAGRLMELFPEVDEAYCTRYADPDGGSTDHPTATAEQALGAASRALPFVDATAMRWLVIETEPESIPSAGEEVGA